MYFIYVSVDGYISKKSLHINTFHYIFSGYLFELIFLDDIRVQFHSSTCGHPVYTLTSLSKVMMDLTLGSLLHFIDLCISFTLVSQYLIIKAL